MNVRQQPGVKKAKSRSPGGLDASWYREVVAQRIGVVVFPGTNCEHDVVEAFEAAEAEADLVWHGSSSVAGFDAVVLPGGFAHGDYLRPGAIARFSPVMTAVAEFAASGGPVLGICNGFQVLTEAHLLPGALQKNKGLTFLCQMTEVEVVSDRSALTAGVDVGRTLSVPINHFEGNYTAEAETLRALESEGRVVLRYVANPNGSANDIAGVCNEAGNVVGLMPHPERASSELMGSTDGLVLLSALIRVASGKGGEVSSGREAASASASAI
jgi:phosphoribosylformylglycinamidine synthase subunit PurQ / glutaminase